MIPAKAVEAAAKALWDLDREPSHREYADCRDGTKRHLRREALAALEAAAPHLVQSAYELGWEDGREGNRDHMPPEPTP